VAELRAVAEELACPTVLGEPVLSEPVFDEPVFDEPVFDEPVPADDGLLHAAARRATAAVTRMAIVGFMSAVLRASR
jgi:hypothetical protein